MPGSAWNALQTAAPWNFPHHRGNGSIIVIPTTEENKKTLQCWITSMIIIKILRQKQLLSKESFLYSTIMLIGYIFESSVSNLEWDCWADCTLCTKSSLLDV